MNIKINQNHSKKMANYISEECNFVCLFLFKNLFLIMSIYVNYVC